MSIIPTVAEVLANSKPFEQRLAGNAKGLKLMESENNAFDLLGEIVERTPLGRLPTRSTDDLDEIARLQAECDTLAARLADAQHDRDEFRRVVRALTAQTMTAQGMADCMDMLRDAMIEAKLIDPAIAPMFFAEQIIPKLKRLAEIEELQPTHFLDDKGELHPYTADKFQQCESQGLRRLYALPVADIT